MSTRLMPLTVVGAIALCSCAPAGPITDSRIQPEPSPAASSASAEASGEASAEPENSCVTMAGKLTLEEQVGQLYMVGVSTSGLDETTKAVIRDNKLGSVVLLGTTTSGASAIRLLTAELGSLGTAELPLLVAVDQEGGTVQRLQGEGFTRMPSAREQGALAPGALTTEAALWGEELAAAGVNYNLAPVADVVAEDRRNTNAPIGKLQRDFGSEPDQVGAKVQEFIEGMKQAGIITSVKHFPGLGQVTSNTDFAAARDEVVTADSPLLEPFRAAIAAGADSVMVSSAVFTRIDPDNEAVFSEAVITQVLRGQLGYDGVVIADDLGAAQSVKDIAAKDRGVRFFQAGGDLAINADPSIMSEMVEATLDLASSDEAFAQRIATSAARVLTMKESAGLVDCGAS